jgi:hypothetical protein
MEVEQTPLPGVGIRYDFATTAGRRLGLVIHRDGRTEIIIYSQDDPDNCSESVTLQPQEYQCDATSKPGHPPTTRPSLKVGAEASRIDNNGCRFVIFFDSGKLPCSVESRLVVAAFRRLDRSRAN